MGLPSGFRPTLGVESWSCWGGARVGGGGGSRGGYIEFK